MLLWGAWAIQGKIFEDLKQAIVQKMKINKARKWRAPDKDGVVNHIK